MEKKDRIVGWLRKQLEISGKKGFVVGVSGGIDSAVTEALCRLATENVTAVKLPLEDIREIYNAFLKQFPPMSKITKANLQARIRMCMLYIYANEFNYLVCGTGNKSELFMGYFTKYGDGGVDILPLGNLTKTEVRELARQLNIPQEIIDKPPSAGLWEGQTDEEEMGITYKQIDMLLDRFSKNKHKITPIPIFE